MQTRRSLHALWEHAGRRIHTAASAPPNPRRRHARQVSRQAAGALLAACLAAMLPAYAESAAHSAGKAVGEFGTGVGEAVGQGMAESLNRLQPRWVTIDPKSKAACLEESGGVVNPVFVRCRNGRQELIRLDANGQKIVISERPIPTH
ncbi:MAG: hypothetical protein PHP86_10215 [Nevskiales bacterium]|nr:hypothetical protein [Nevskiales bacterium]